MINQTHPIRITEHEVNDTAKLQSLAKLFVEGVLPSYPLAVLVLKGSGMVGTMLWDRLERTYGIPRGKTRVVTEVQADQRFYVDAIIFFVPPPAGKTKVTAEFRIDLDALPVQVDFEVSPDGTIVQESTVQWTPLKMKIKPYAAAGRIKNLKVATKILGTYALDRDTLEKVEKYLKGKLKTVLSADIVLPGKTTISVEFFGAAGVKLKDGQMKTIFETGLMLSVPIGI